jgi:hypothetical protein
MYDAIGITLQPIEPMEEIMEPTLFINMSAVQRAVTEAFRAGQIRDSDPVKVRSHTVRNRDGSVDKGQVVYFPAVGDRPAFYL